jgi:hypothetical protein
MPGGIDPRGPEAVMYHRDLDSSSQPLPWTYPDLVLRTRPNWTAVAFLALLAALHLTVGGRAFAAGRWEGYVSLTFGTMFALAAVATFNLRREVAVLYHHGRLRLRTGVGRWSFERSVPFCDVHAVRVTLGPGCSARDSFVELICRREDVPCPPSAVPRHLGLLLAMMTGAPLVKVSADPRPTRRTTTTTTSPPPESPAPAPQQESRDGSAAG